MRSRAGDLEVKLLLYAISKTTAFEKLLAQKYANSPYILSVSEKVICSVCFMFVFYCLQLAPPTSEPIKDEKVDVVRS